MEITEVAVDGLRREYRVVVGAEEIEKEIQKRLEELQRKVRIPGFRPGHVPQKLLRQRYGQALLGEVVKKTLDEGSKRIVAEHELRPALNPRVEITSFEEGKDLEFRVDLEVLPEVPEVDLSAIELVRYEAEVEEDKIARSLQNLAEARREYHRVEEDRPAREGDRVVVDVTARAGEEVIANLSGENVEIPLGAGSVPEVFEQALLGRRAGETFTFTWEVPETHPEESIRGRTVQVEGTVKEIREAPEVAIDDALAKAYGYDDLEALREAVRARLEDDYRQRARERMKRQLLDWLAENVRFEVPRGMVELEFENIWRQLLEDMERRGRSFDSLGTSEEELREEYRAIAERRVRLGLILSDIGNRNQIHVESEELQQAVWREAMRYRGREREVIEHFRAHPEALEPIRAHLFEDKVVDFIFQLAKVRAEQVTPEELYRAEEEEEEREQEESPQAASDEAAARAQ